MTEEQQEKFQQIYELLQWRVFDEKLINEAFEYTGIEYKNQARDFINMTETEWKARAIIDFKNRIDD